MLSDLVLRPKFYAEDIAKEKQVVLEEIKMDEDNPEYLVHELFTQNFWRAHPLGLPILGTPENEKPQFSRDALFDCFRSWYAPNNIVITAAGNLEHASLVDLASREFGGATRTGAPVARTAPRTNASVEQRHKKELEQIHIVLGVPSYPVAHERRYAASLLNIIILGGGMSSRLFQNIRERQGLMYAIGSELSPYTDLRACAGFIRRNFALTRREVDSIGSRGIPPHPAGGYVSAGRIVASAKRSPGRAR